MKRSKTSSRFLPLVGILAVLLLAGISAKTSYSFRVMEKSIVQHKQVVFSHGGKSEDILDKIAACESGGKQFDSTGKVIRGKQNSMDIGKWQINLDYHGKTALAMGLNLFDEKDNRTYAEYLYAKEGSAPWNWSKHCWSKQNN